MNNKVEIFDTTLRDGDQSVHATFSSSGKILIANKLEEIGVDIIEVGFPASSQEEFETIEHISKNLKKAKICVLARVLSDDIEACEKSTTCAKKRRINLFVPTSDLHIKEKLNLSRNEVIELAKEAIRNAKKYFDEIQFSFEDSTRSDKVFLKKIAQEVINLGVKIITLPDTVGCSTPQEYKELIQYIKKNVKGEYTVSCHCHNDLGLATANTLFGIEGGARQIEVCVNGIGERAGNCPIEEISVLLSTKSSFTTNIKIQDLYKLSKLVTEKSGMIVQKNKPIVGDDIFSHKSGIHQHGVLKNSKTYEFLDIKELGREKRKIVIGKHSGDFSKKASKIKKYSKDNDFLFL